MTVTSASSKATTALKNITAAAIKSPTKPIELSPAVFTALEKKLVALAKKDAPKASGLVDLMEELHRKGNLKIVCNAGPISYAAANMWTSGMNSVKDVLNHNAVESDDKPTSPVMR